jgi:hypothetical protein
MASNSFGVDKPDASGERTIWEGCAFLKISDVAGFGPAMFSTHTRSERILLPLGEKDK